MLRSAPPQTSHSLEGMLLVKVCDGEACVLAPVALHLRVYDDNSWFVAYWDPECPVNNATASGVERCEADSLQRMLAAISQVALTPSRS